MMTEFTWRNFLQNPRHIEFQILTDTHGNGIHLEREIAHYKGVIKK